jgi:hypothetical protein
VAARSVFLPVGMAVWMKMRLPQTMGEDAPEPGREAFQRRLVFSSNLVGGVASGAVPLWAGPRHSGQLVSAVAVARRAERRDEASRMDFMEGMMGWIGGRSKAGGGCDCVDFPLSGAVR